MSKFSERYKTDRALEEDGVFVDFGDSVLVKVRRYSSKNVKDARIKLERPYAKQIRLSTISEDTQETLTKRLFAEAIVVDWKGVYFSDDTLASPYTPEKALRIFEEFPDFMNDIITAVMQRDTFKKEEDEDDTKN